MKPLSFTCRTFLCIVVMMAQTAVSNTQSVNPVEKNLKIRVDFQSAREVTNLVELNGDGDGDLNRVAGLFGNQQLIKKIARSDSAITAETFKQTLCRAIENQNLAEKKDLFEWQTVKKNLPEILLLINQIENDQKTLFVNLENLNALIYEGR